MRWARSVAWACDGGVPPGIVVDDGVGAVRFRPVPPALRLMRKTSAPGRSGSVSTARWRSRGGAGQLDVADAAARAGLARSGPACWRTARRPARGGPPRPAAGQQLHEQRRSLADSRTPCAASPRTRRGSQQTWRSFISASRMVIVEAREALLPRSPARTSRVRGDAQALVEIALRAAQLDGRTISVLGGRSRGHLLLGAAEDERARPARAARAALAVPLALDRRAEAVAEPVGVAEQARASGSRTATTARRGGSRPACRSGRGGGAR